MRITQNILNQSALDGMQNNLLRLKRYQQQAVTTKRVSRPEDDPFAVEQALGFRTHLKSNETSRRNIAMSSDWLNATDKTLGDVSTLLTRAKSLALKGSNETLGVEGRNALAAEVDGMLEQAVATANTRHGDHYLFSGFQIDTPAFDVTRDPGTGYITSTTYNGDSGLIMREIEPGIDMAVNIVGDSHFTDTFNTLINLRDALVASPFDVSNVSPHIDELETQLDNTLNLQASIGTKVRRLESTIERMETAEVGVKELLSNAEDADMAEVVSQLNQQQFVYQTALAVNAQVLRTSLLDFLR
jgi:flagellar hook-associated protein 3 FlgL